MFRFLSIIVLSVVVLTLACSGPEPTSPPTLAPVPTDTPISTPPATATATPTPILPTATPTATPTASPSPTPTPSATPTATPTATPRPRPTATHTPTPVRSIEISGTGATRRGVDVLPPGEYELRIAITGNETGSRNHGYFAVWASVYSRPRVNLTEGWSRTWHERKQVTFGLEGDHPPWQVTLGVDAEPVAEWKITITPIGPGSAPPTATPTPRPLPTATPTPRPRSPEYTAGLGYARSENLGDDDTGIYATAYVVAKELGLSNDDARSYASGYLFHWAVGFSVTSRRAEADDAANTYGIAFENAIQEGSTVASALGIASQAIRSDQEWWPFNFDPPEQPRFVDDYGEAYARSGETGTTAHGYAVIYAGLRYVGDSEDRATDFAEAQVRGMKISNSESMRSRIEYGLNYRVGYDEALWRAEPEQKYTVPHKVQSWAAAYAQGYGGGYNRARNSGWDDPDAGAQVYARLYAIAKVDIGLPDQAAYLNADAYFRGYDAATERGLLGDARSIYAWDYYSAYFDTKVQRGWPVSRAEPYSTAYAEAKMEGRTDDEAKEYARVYERAFTEAKGEGSTDTEAHVYASAYAEAEVGPAPTPTPMASG